MKHNEDLNNVCFYCEEYATELEEFIEENFWKDYWGFSSPNFDLSLKLADRYFIEGPLLICIDCYNELFKEADELHKNARLESEAEERD